MSLVTNVLLSHGILEEQAALIGEPFPDRSTAAGQRLMNIADGPAADNWGGTKFPECELWAAAFNYLHLAELRAKIEAIPWREPEHVQLFVQGQEDDKFAVYEFRQPHGRLVKVL